ncbi:WG repeat-containing protein, partial [Cetobacterium sp.]|uniref:WG repeat-containing protein n=1 Tax=Cetobacterium sp. TaxID=2071632 RepID=UPI003F2B1DB0
KQILELSSEKYQNIVPISKEIIFLKKDDTYIYIKKLETIKTNYKEIKKISENYLLVKDRSDLWRLIDIDNKEFYLPKNDEIVSISEDRYVLLKLRNRYFYFDLLTGIEITDTYEKLGNFQEGMAMFVRDEKIGYIDTYGKEIIKNQFDFAGNFENGYAIVNNLGERYKYINKFGEISANEYDFIKSYKNNILLLKDEKENILKVIEREIKNESGIINLEHNFYLLRGRENEKSEIYSIQQNKIIKSLEGRYLGVSEGVILLERDNKVVVYDLETQKEKSLNLTLEELEIYKKDYFIKKEDEKSYLYNKNGKKISKGYSLIMPKAEGKFIVASENGFGAINENGKEIVECKYDSIQLIPNYIIAETNAEKSLYDNKGIKKLPTSYRDILYINEKLYVYDEDGWRYVL